MKKHWIHKQVRVLGAYSKEFKKLYGVYIGGNLDLKYQNWKGIYLPLYHKMILPA